MNICKELREAMGLPITGLAKQSQMSINTLRLLEVGGTVTQRSLEKLANFFGVTPEELDGTKPLDIKAWLAKRNQKETVESSDSTPEPEPRTVAVQRQTPELHQRGIVQLIRASSAAANYYLEEGWILIDTVPMKDEEGFYCLLGSTKVYSSEEFRDIKSKRTPKARGYWMSKP